MSITRDAPPILTRMDRGETDVALRTLHCFDSELIDPELRTVRCDDQSLTKLSNIMNQYEPDVVFVPCFDESRPDYIKTAAMAAKALENYPYNAECYCYSFEGVRGPNALVDITLTIEDKIEAMKERHTQRKVVDDEENIRSMHLFSYSTRTMRQVLRALQPLSQGNSYVGMARDLGFTRTLIV